MKMQNAPQISGTLRKFALRVPENINECSGIRIFGKLIKSIIFSTDLSIIKNSNADAIMAVYPFTPQPIITQALMLAADIPVFAGVGGGLTRGNRVLNLAQFAEMQGAMGVVVNAPTSNDVVKRLSARIDIPVIVTVVNEDFDFKTRIDSGAAIFNVSAGVKTAELVEKIRYYHDEFPIIATGGPNEASIDDTIKAGANSITWTPPSNSEIFKSVMSAYREGKPHP